MSVLFYAVLRARRTIAVTRPLVLRLLLRDHVQAAGVRKTVAGHTSLSTAVVIQSAIIAEESQENWYDLS